MHFSPLLLPVLNLSGRSVYFARRSVVARLEIFVRYIQFYTVVATSSCNDAFIAEIILPLKFDTLENVRL